MRNANPPGLVNAITRHAQDPDETVLMLREMGIPVTRENWLMLNFAGNPPEGSLTEPLEEGQEDELPKELRIGEDPDDGSEESES